MTLTRNQQLRISASRADKVADRICRRLAGYVRDSARGIRPLKIVTTHRVISVYRNGSVEQSIAPVDMTPWLDPCAETAADTRYHAVALSNAAKARRRGEYESARESINNARILRRLAIKTQVEAA